MLPFTLDQSEAEQDAAIQEVLLRDDPEEVAILKEALQALYDEQLLALDRGVDLLLLGLEEQGKLENTLVILSGDHGEGLLDKGNGLGHGGTVREELIHVPLIFYNSRFITQNIENCISTSMDLLPTVAALWMLEPMLDTEGKALEECREMVFSSLYMMKEDQTIWKHLNLESVVERVEVDCESGNVEGYNLLKDPEALNMLPWEELNSVLVQELMAQRDKVLLAQPEMRCP
jgi:hypothetical protein